MGFTMLPIDHKKNIRPEKRGDWIWSGFLYPTITCVIVIGIFFMLPWIGKYLTAANARVYFFLKNIYHAQEYADQEGLLQRELVLARQNFIKTKRLEEENTLLRSELQLNALKEQKKFINASVTGKGFAFGSDIIIIDEGTRAGIQPGDALIATPNIFIGFITTALPERSYARLISDSSFQISAITIHGARGITKGGVGGQIIFDEIPQSSRIQENDILMTTNENAGIPAGLMIGEVGKILSHSTDIVQKTEVKSPIDPYLLEVVSVITQ